MHPGQMRLARSMGVRLSEPMDLSFLEPARPEFARGALFFESPRAAQRCQRFRAAERWSNWI